MQTPELLSVDRVRRWGGSHAVSLNKAVRTVMGIQVGDQIAFRKVGRYVFISVVRAEVVAPVSKDEVAIARRSLGV